MHYPLVEFIPFSRYNLLFTAGSVCDGCHAVVMFQNRVDFFECKLVTKFWSIIRLDILDWQRESLYQMFHE